MNKLRLTYVVHEPSVKVTLSNKSYNANSQDSHPIDKSRLANKVVLPYVQLLVSGEITFFQNAKELILVSR